MINLLLVKNNLNYRKIKNNRIFYIQNEEVYCNELSSFEIIWKSKVDLSNGRIFPPFVHSDNFIIPQSNSSTVYDSLGKTMYSIKDVFLMNTIFQGKSELFFSRMKTKSFGIWDLEEKKEIWKINYKDLSANVIGVNQDFILLKKRNLLYCLSYKDGSLRWQIDFGKESFFEYEDFLTKKPQNGEIQKGIALNNNIFYLAINRDAIVAVELNTGTIKKTKKDLINPLTKTSNINKPYSLPYPPNAILVNKKIVCLIGQYYWEWDLHNDQFNIMDLTEYFLENKVVPKINTNYINYRNLVIFISNPRQISAFNTLTKRIEWNYNLKISNGNSFWPDTLAIDNNLLIINDYKKNTYIFEITN